MTKWRIELGRLKGKRRIMVIAVSPENERYELGSIKGKTEARLFLSILKGIEENDT